MTTAETDTETPIASLVMPKVAWLPKAYVKRCYHRKEKGDAELFANLYANLVVFDHAGKVWNFYNGNYWIEDPIGRVKACVTDGVAAQYIHVAAELRREGNADAEAIEKYATLLRFKKKIESVLGMAASEEGIGISGNEWDADPMLFGVQNGTIDLNTGALRCGNPLDYIKSISSVPWLGLDTPAPRWEQFLAEIFDGDCELIGFVQRLLGYGLTGLNREHIFPVLWGEGRNGKDTLLETIKYVVGEMATPVSEDVMLDNGRNSNSPTPHLAAMRGKRLVWVDETNEGARLNAGLVKMLTGGNTIVARPLHSKPITFEPQYLLMLITNHQPHADSDDYALWKRIVLLKFTQSFIDDPVRPNEHKADHLLRDKLRAEASGILAWMVRGCLAWRKDGLHIPQSVRLYTTEYQSGEDTTATFIEQACIQGGEVSLTSLYRAYFRWCKDYGVHNMSMVAFGRRMTKRYEKVRKTSGFYYLGISIPESLLDL